MRRLCAFLISVFAFTCAAAHAKGSPRIFFSEYRSIYASTIGSNVVDTVYTHPSDNGRPMCVAVNGSTLFWTTYYPGQLRRSDLDGGNVAVLVDQGDTTTRAIQFRDNKIYWANESQGRIYRSNLDGGNVETVISGYLGYYNGIWDFELYGDRIYWVGWATNRISSTRLDGSDYREILLNGVNRAFSLEIENDRFYFSDNRDQPHTGRILSAALNGTDVQTLVDGPYALSVDVFDGRVYYNDENSFNLYSVTLSGTDHRVELQRNSGISWQIDVVPEPQFCGAAVMVAMMRVSRRR